MTKQVQEEQQNDDEKMGYFTPGEITVAVRHPSGIEPDELLERLRHELREMLAEFWQQGGQERSLLLRKLQQSFGFDHGVYQTALRASSLLQDDDLELLQQAVVDLAQEDVVTFPAGEQRRSQLSQVFLRIEDEEANIYHYSEVLIFLAAELTLRQERVSGDRQGIRIQGISPGWRFGGAPGGNLISGGPGAKPVPPEGQVSAEDARIHLEIGGAG